MHDFTSSIRGVTGSQVTRDYESGPYPWWNWFYCPAGGGACVVVPNE